MFHNSILFRIIKIKILCYSATINSVNVSADTPESKNMAETLQSLSIGHCPISFNQYIRTSVTWDTFHCVIL